jgi:hypothetical protein
MLVAVPRHNTAAEVSERKDRTVAVTVQTRRPPFLRRPPLSWMVPVHQRRTAVLDHLGAEVWRLCDGRRTVEQIVDRFAGAHGLTFHEARVAVTEYLRTLMQRGALAVVFPENANPEAGAVTARLQNPEQAVSEDES